MKNIALTGPQGSGKDAVAEILVRDYGYTRIAFADALRAEIVAAFNCNPALLTDRSQKDILQPSMTLNHCADAGFTGRILALMPASKLESVDGVIDAMEQPRSPRWIMQKWGTEYRRATQGQTYWHAQLLNAFEAATTPVVITDCRFDDEARFCTRSLFAELWCINRPDHDYKPGHASEQPLADCWIDRWIENTGTLQDLATTVAMEMDYMQCGEREAA